ncbi:hypothetical protein QYF36_004033 [Acer negundo]|nr:hypothetical protein QYF36_004033 [Acer negundo]
MLDKRINHLNGRSFSNMRNLRLLEIRNVDLSEDIEYLSNELRFLKWPEYPLNSLPSNFEPHKLFELNLCRSKIEYLWKDKKAFEKLKTIKLNYSQNLIETPDFTMVPNLEMLDLEAVESNHLWLTFVSRVMFTSRLSIDDVSVSGSTYISAWFGYKSEVIKCGIRLVYKQDIEDFQELPAAESSTFHQNRNCSLAEDFSGCSSQFPSSASSSSFDSSSIQWEYDLFLSFREVPEDLFRDVIELIFDKIRSAFSTDEEPGSEEEDLFRDVMKN